MATTNPSQLFLLSDHIKLSLLERQRAASLNLEPNAHNAEIARSLDSFRTGLESLEAEHKPGLLNDLPQLRQQYGDLHHEYDGTSTAATAASTTQPNDPSLTADFSRASQPLATSPSRTHKSVRFRDDPSTTNDANRAALLPYTDDPADDAPDHAHLDNAQIHQYHSHVMAEQDEQLDRLGVSIGRQRELSMAIGDELEGQTMLLDDVDTGVSRHQSQIDRARKRVGRVARKARENASVTIIVTLVVILVLLIVVTK